MALPGELTKAQVLEAGKQLLIVTKDCEGDGQALNSLVFTGIGNIPSDPYTFIDATITNFKPFPDCDRSTVFAADPDHTSLWRIYEDRTMLGSVIHPERALTVEDMMELTRCGINWPTMDMLRKKDPRIFAHIWSWAENYPQAGQGQCAAYVFDQGIINIPCESKLSGFACQEKQSREFKVIQVEGPWQEGKNMCQTFLGLNWNFAVPVNGAQMRNLKETMQLRLGKSTWVNYAINKTGNWEANI